MLVLHSETYNESSDLGREETMRRYFELAAVALAAIIGLGGFTVAAQAQYLITGNDEKQFV